MNIVEVLLLAMALSVDALLVAGARGLVVDTARYRREVWLLPMGFGIAHVVAPLCGWAAGAQLDGRWQLLGRWIAFLLLAGIGAKMMWDGWRPAPETCAEPAKPPAVAPLWPLVVATSLDAVAAGISLPFMGASLVLSVLLIGVVAALAGLLGMVVGRQLGARVAPAWSGVGGLVLFAIGLKTLVGGA